jgi:phosphopantetheinyl transferase
VHLWTAKESLSKILRTGLLLAFSRIETTEWTWNANVGSVAFAEFPQFRSTVVWEDPWVVAWTYWARSRLADAGHLVQFMREGGT